MAQFDKRTLDDWKQRDIADVSYFLIERGCAGQKVAVFEEISPDMDHRYTGQENITFHTRSIETDFFSDIRITHAGSKWIVSGNAINTHCGCGSSFSRLTGNALQDKITRTRELIRQKKEKVHV
jgi:Fe-S cluster assembly iron-binding protein IscA